MLGNFSFNDAYRIIKNVVDERINMLIRSGAGIEVTWGTVASIDNSSTCSVYLFGDAIPSTGFRFENGIKPNVLDPVRVSIDKRGNRWVDAVLGDSTLAHPKLEIDVRAGEIRAGDGTVVPEDIIVHDHDADYSDIAHDHDADYSDIGHLHSGQELVPARVITSGPNSRFLVGNGTLGSVASDTDEALMVYQPNSSSGDAFMTFHNPGSYAVHFGLDRTTSDLFVGGWSMGAVKNKIWSARNSMVFSQYRAGRVSATLPIGAAAASVAVSWSAMSGVPSGAMLTQVSIPANSGIIIVKTSSSTWSSTGMNIYYYTGNASGFASAITFDIDWFVWRV